jgi:hypothetical protein
MNSLQNKHPKDKPQLFFAVVFFLLVAIMAVRLPFDTDFWWHLRAGQLTVEQAKPLLTDLSSYTRYGTPWLNHSWLSQAIFFITYSFTGYFGIMILVALLATIGIFFIFRALNGPVLLKSFVLILVVLISAVIWSPRPQIFTYLCFSILIYWFQEYIEDPKISYFIRIMILFIFWSNLHAGFSIGIAYIGLFETGKLAEELLNNQFSITSLKKHKWGFGLFVMAILVVCVNPNFIGVWTVQFNTIGVQALQNYISEWASPDFHILFQQPYLWVWIILVFFIATTKKNLPLERVFPLLFFGGLGFISRRNFAPFALVMAPVLIDLIGEFYRSRLKVNNYLQKIFSRSVLSKKEAGFKFRLVFNLSFVGFLAIVLIGKTYYLGHPIIMDAYESRLFPKNAISWLENHPEIHGNLLNSYAWGGYLSWKLPDRKIFIDGRTDLYGDEIISDWMIMVNGSPEWKIFMNKYNIEWTFLEPETALLNELKNSGWEELYRDSLVIIMENNENK